MFAVLAVVTLINVLVAAGFAVGALVRPAAIIRGANGTAPEQTLARLAAARAIPLLIGTLGAVATGSGAALFWLGIVGALMQAGDGTIGLLAREPRMTWGPFFIAAVQLVAVILYATAH